MLVRLYGYGSAYGSDIEGAGRRNPLWVYPETVPPTPPPSGPVVYNRVHKWKNSQYINQILSA